MVGLSIIFLPSLTPGSYPLCARYDGTAGSAENVTVRCDDQETTLARYVVVQIPNTVVALQLCEVKVEGTGTMEIKFILHKKQ